MTSTGSSDLAIVGGGIVGMATAMALTRSAPGTAVVVLEKEPRLAAHQTGNNSGVIHSGLYYKPGSLKARNCVAGREALYRFCAEHDIPAERCGKLVVATRPEQLAALDELERRGTANGLTGLRRLRQEELAEHEPHVSGSAGLLVPETGIVDYVRVTQAYAREAEQRGAAVVTGARVQAVSRTADGLVVETTAGDFPTRFLVNCAGLHCDRVARLCGVDPGLRIVPFRGEYYELVPGRRHLVRNLIYPVPDPSFPFLGVHFTRRIGGGVEAGPNAVLALKREGYSRASFSPRDSLGTLAYPGFWRLAGRFWRTGLAEQWRSFSTSAFVRALAELVPEITASDVHRAGAGVRAQALAPDGALLDDFSIVESERMVHVLNAPSPAATASISIGEVIAARVVERFGLGR
jgi:(S)-2-hydroxyglutarate dehydrogenase